MHTEYLINTLTDCLTLQYIKCQREMIYNPIILGYLGI